MKTKEQKLIEETLTLRKMWAFDIKYWICFDMREAFQNGLDALNKLSDFSPAHKPIASYIEELSRVNDINTYLAENPIVKVLINSFVLGGQKLIFIQEEMLCIKLLSHYSMLKLSVSNYNLPFEENTKWGMAKLETLCGLYFDKEIQSDEDIFPYIKGAIFETLTGLIQGAKQAKKGNLLYNKLRKFAELIIEKTENPSLESAILFYTFGQSLLRNMESPPEAKFFFEHSLLTLDSLDDNAPQVKYQKWYVLGDLASYWSTIEHYKDGFEYYNKAIDIYKSLPDEIKQNEIASYLRTLLNMMTVSQISTVEVNFDELSYTGWGTIKSLLTANQITGNIELLHIVYRMFHMFSVLKKPIAEEMFQYLNLSLENDRFLSSTKTKEYIGMFYYSYGLFIQNKNLDVVHTSIAENITKEALMKKGQTAKNLGSLKTNEYIQEMQKAFHCYEKAVQLLEGINKQRTAQAYINGAQILEEIGHNESSEHYATTTKALSWLSKAIDLLNSTKTIGYIDKYELFRALTLRAINAMNLAGIQFKSNDPKYYDVIDVSLADLQEARQYCEDDFGGFQQLQVTVQAKDEFLSLTCYSTLLELLILKGKRNKNFEDALIIADSMRLPKLMENFSEAIALRNRVSHDHVKELYSLSRRRKQIISTLGRLHGRGYSAYFADESISSLLSLSARHQIIENLENELAMVEKQYEKINSSLFDTDKKKNASDDLDILDLRNVLSDNQIVLHYTIRAHASFCFIVTKTELDCVQLNIDSLSMALWQDKYTRTITDKNEKSLFKITDEISNKLIFPIEHILKRHSGKQLVVIANSPMQTVPICACRFSNGEYVLERHAISYAPNLKYFVNTEDKTQTDVNYCFIAANPRGDLVFSEIEGLLIKNHFNNISVRYQSVKKVTQEYIAREDIQNNIWHYAGHLQFDTSSILNSKLLLWKRIGEENDVTLKQLFNERNFSRTDLTVLSACESGRVPFTMDDNALSFVHLFLLGGSRCVVSSLWRISDISTALLMDKFYGNMRSKMSIDIALASAQIWLSNLTCAELDKLLDNLMDSHDWLTSDMEEIIQNRRTAIRQNYNDNDKPFKNPYWWAAFYVSGQASIQLKI